MKFQSSIVTQLGLIVTLDNKVYTVPSDRPGATALYAAFKAGDAETFLELFNTSVEKVVVEGKTRPTGITIEGEDVFYNGNLLHNSAVDAIKLMISQGFNIDPMVKFLENMMKNPSYNSIKEMWDFISQMGLTITEDGHFLAYKAVRADYTDKHSGKIDNTPGSNPPRMERSEVDDNTNNACSHGYHVGALSYAGPSGWFHNEGNHVLICKVNPADVVSVPRDCSCSKLRCCYYEPVGEFDGELQLAVYADDVGTDFAAVPKPPKSWVSTLDKDELLEGEIYTAIYTKQDGSSKRRYFMVEEVGYDSYTVELLHPEGNDGEYRCFKFDRLSDIKLWDGVEEEEEEEVCNYYGDYLADCDGQCEDEDSPRINIFW